MVTGANVSGSLPLQPMTKPSTAANMVRGSTFL